MDIFHVIVQFMLRLCCLIAGHLKERLGTDVDKDNLYMLYSQLGYQICIQENLTGMVSKLVFIQTGTDWYRDVQRCTDLYSLMQTCTETYRHLQACTDLYRLVQTCTGWYRLLQTCTNMYRFVETCTKIYRLMNTFASLWLCCM